jgi:hypothetical protein
MTKRRPPEDPSLFAVELYALKYHGRAKEKLHEQFALYVHDGSQHDAIRAALAASEATDDLIFAGRVVSSIKVNPMYTFVRERMTPELRARFVARLLTSDEVTAMDELFHPEEVTPEGPKYAGQA